MYVCVLSAIMYGDGLTSSISLWSIWCHNRLSNTASLDWILALNLAAATAAAAAAKAAAAAAAAAATERENDPMCESASCTRPWRACVRLIQLRPLSQWIPRGEKRHKSQLDSHFRPPPPREKMDTVNQMREGQSSLCLAHINVFSSVLFFPALVKYRSLFLAGDGSDHPGTVSTSPNCRSRRRH